MLDLFLQQAGTDKKLINFPKHHLIARSIADLLRYQSNNFGLVQKGGPFLFLFPPPSSFLLPNLPLFLISVPSEPLYTFLRELPGLQEKELYELSLVRSSFISLLNG